MANYREKWLYQKHCLMHLSAGPPSKVLLHAQLLCCSCPAPGMAVIPGRHRGPSGDVACAGTIKPAAAVWSCVGGCWVTLHLGCMQVGEGQPPGLLRGPVLGGLQGIKAFRAFDP
jgi:hypothetical protein